MPSDTNNLRFANDYENNTRYLTNITVMQYNESVKQVFAVELQDAFPIGMASQQLSWSDDSLHRLSVQFSYRKYRPIYEGNTDAQQILNTLLGSVAAANETTMLFSGHTVSRSIRRWSQTECTNLR